MQDDIYSNIEFGVPFRINRPRGKDMTVWRKDPAHSNGCVLRMYWHGDNFWINPPTDTNMEANAIKRANRYGIELLPKDYDKRYESRRAELIRSGVKPWEVDDVWFKEQN
jgi:hypothetical protein